jgi:dolichol-phosphate mannosyltransferase
LHFQTTRRLDKEITFSIHYLLLHSLILLSPIGIILSALSVNKIKAMCAQVANKNGYHAQQVCKLILCLTFLPLSVFIYFSLTHTPRFHWTAPIWLSLIPLSAYLISPTSESLVNKSALRKLVLYGGAFLCLGYGALLHYSTLGLPFSNTTKLTSHYFWQQAAQQTHEIEQEIIKETGQRPVIICLSKWSIASSLRFYDVDGAVDNIVSRNFINESATMYEEWTEPKDWRGHPVLFVAMHKKDIRKNKLNHFTDSMQAVEEYTLQSDNRKVRTLLLRRANSYQPQ